MSNTFNPVPGQFPPSDDFGGAKAPAGDPKAAKPGRMRRGKKTAIARGDKPPTRTLTPYRLGIIVFVVFGLAVFGLMGSSPKQYVAIAKSPVPALGTLSLSVVDAVAVTDEALVPGAFKAKTKDEAIKLALKTLTGAAQYPIPAKSQLTAEMFADVSLGLGYGLSPSERLVSISASVSGAITGKLRAGDRVDVVFASTNGQGGILTSVVASDILIVATSAAEQTLKNVADKQVGENKDTAAADLLPTQPLPGIYVLRTPAELVTVLATVDAASAFGSGKLYLVYRAPGATGQADLGATDLTSIQCTDPGTARYACASR